MNDAMPSGKKVPIKDALGVEIGEVVSAEFDPDTQSITFVGELFDERRFKATQPVGISFGPEGIIAIDKEK